MLFGLSASISFRIAVRHTWRSVLLPPAWRSEAASLDLIFLSLSDMPCAPAGPASGLSTALQTMPMVPHKLEAPAIKQLATKMTDMLSSHQLHSVSQATRIHSCGSRPCESIEHLVRALVLHRLATCSSPPLLPLSLALICSSAALPSSSVQASSAMPTELAPASSSFAASA